MSSSRQRGTRMFFNSPSWRWDRACYEHRKRLKGESDFLPSSDILVMQMTRFLDLWNSDKVPKDRLRTVLPFQSRLVDAYLDISPACLRFCIEAAALAGAGDDYIALNMGKELDPLSYRMYKLLFFDVDKALVSKAFMWLERNVLEPASFYEGPLKQSGYAWKLCALQGGLDKLSAMCLHGDVSDESVDWIRRQAVIEHVRNTATKAHAPVRASDEVEAQLAASDIRQLAEIHERREEATRSANLKSRADSDSVISNLYKVISLYGGTEKLGGREEVDAIKYTEEDLK